MNLKTGKNVTFDPKTQSTVYGIRMNNSWLSSDNDVFSGIESRRRAHMGT